MKKKLQIYGFCNKGFNGQAINIQCDVHNGFPGFDIVGLPDKAINESKERVRTALKNSGFRFPQQHILVSLSPAGIPKSGSLLDLGISLSILFAQSENTGAVYRIMTAGELALDGTILADSSALGAISWAKKLGCSLCIIPFSAPGCIQAKTLNQVFLECGEFYNSDSTLPSTEEKTEQRPIFSDVIGLNREKEILSMAASGFHSLLLFGPPGVGKTMLCTKLQRLVPRLSEKDKLDLIHIYGCANQVLDNPDEPVLINVPHDCSPVQFVGGNNSKAPGIGALSHRGVLLLDEITKFSPSLRESVKEAYDKGLTSSSKSGEQVDYPARFMMAANLNPCPCGGLGSESKACRCTTGQIVSYWNRLSSPIIERFDIRIPIEEANIANLLKEENRPDIYYIDKINTSFERQKFRYKDFDIEFNGQVHYDSKALSLFSKDIDVLESTGLCDKTIRNTRNLIGIVTLARSIADYKDKANITEEDFLKAIELRKFGLGDYYWKVVG